MTILRLSLLAAAFALIGTSESRAENWSATAVPAAYEVQMRWSWPLPGTPWRTVATYDDYDDAYDDWRFRIATSVGAPGSPRFRIRPVYFWEYYWRNSYQQAEARYGPGF